MAVAHEGDEAETGRQDPHRRHADIDPAALHRRDNRGEAEALDVALEAEHVGDGMEEIDVEADLLVFLVEIVERLEIERHAGGQRAFRAHFVRQELARRLVGCGPGRRGRPRSVVASTAAVTARKRRRRVR